MRFTAEFMKLWDCSFSLFVWLFPITLVLIGLCIANTKRKWWGWDAAVLVPVIPIVLSIAWTAYFVVASGLDLTNVPTDPNPLAVQVLYSLRWPFLLGWAYLAINSREKRFGRVVAFLFQAVWIWSTNWGCEIALANSWTTCLP